MSAPMLTEAESEFVDEMSHDGNAPMRGAALIRTTGRRRSPACSSVGGSSVGDHAAATNTGGPLPVAKPSPRSLPEEKD